MKYIFVTGGVISSLGKGLTAALPGTHARRLYGAPLISERHRHRYEFNNAYRDRLTQRGLKIAGHYTEEDLVELIEIPSRPYFVACQFHPEFKSRSYNAHPLFRGFIEAALKRRR